MLLSLGWEAKITAAQQAAQFALIGVRLLYKQMLLAARI
jgi:hypothetical protein